MGQLDGKHVLMFVDDVYEDLELWYPKLRLIEAGAGVTVAGPEAGKVYAGKHGYPAESDAAISDMEDGDFDALVIPGGFAPDKLRRDEKVLELTRAFHASGRPLAYICHAGWIPISAGVVAGFRVTSTPGIKDDLTNAGATWVDEPCVVDRHHITARRPPDLPPFARAIVEMMTQR